MYKKDIVIIFIFFNLIFTSFLITNTWNVKAYTLGLLSNFDNYASYADDGVSQYIQWTHTGGSNDFETYDLNELSSPNSFKIYSEGAGFWNLTNDFDYIYQINISIYFDSTASEGTLTWKFYDSIDTELIYMSINDEIITWYKQSGSEVVYTGAGDHRIYLVITHNSTNQFNVKTYNSGFVLQENHDVGGRSSENWVDFSYITFSANSGHTNYWYFDNFYFQYGDLPTDDCSDMWFQSYIEGEYDNPVQNNRYIEVQYLLESGETITGEVTQVALSISDGQYTYVSSNVSDYTLEFNGQSMGSATGFDVTPNNYWVYWNMSKTITNNYPIFSFGCNASYDGGGVTDPYFWLGIGSHSPYTFPAMRYHNNSSMHTNNLYDGTIYQLGIVYKFLIECYNESEQTEDEDETDIIDFKTFLSEGGPSCDLVFYSHVMGYLWWETLSGIGSHWVDCDYPDDALFPFIDKHGSNYIEIEGDNALSGTIHFVDLYISEFQVSNIDELDEFTLFVNGEFWGSADYLRQNYWGQFYLEWYNEDGTLLTNESPIFEFKSENRYNNYESDGDIFWFLGFMNDPCSFNAMKHDNGVNFGNGDLNGAPMTNLYKQETSTYSMPYHPVTPYFKFFYNESWKQTGEILPDELDNYTDVYGDFFIQFINTDDCYYKVGDKPTLVYNVSDDYFNYDSIYFVDIVNVNTGAIMYSTAISFAGDGRSGFIYVGNAFTDDGYYQIRLYNVTNESGLFGGGYLVNNKLVNSSVVIHVCEKTGTSGQTGGEGGWYGLPYWTPYLLGVFLTLFITMSPLIIALYITRKSKHKELPKIPALLYVGFFFMGLVISVQMTFLPFWLPFVILFGMIVYFAVQWLYGKKGEVTGE